jgi:hypothetical protein
MDGSWELGAGLLGGRSRAVARSLAAKMPAIPCTQRLAARRHQRIRGAHRRPSTPAPAHAACSQPHNRPRRQPRPADFDLVLARGQSRPGCCPPCPTRSATPSTQHPPHTYLVAAAARGAQVGSSLFMCMRQRATACGCSPSPSPSPLPSPLPLPSPSLSPTPTPQHRPIRQPALAGMLCPAPDSTARDGASFADQSHVPSRLFVNTLPQPSSLITPWADHRALHRVRRPMAPPSLHPDVMCGRRSPFAANSVTPCSSASALPLSPCAGPSHPHPTTYIVPTSRTQ